MPELSGVELVKQFRSNENEPYTPFFFYTGHGDYLNGLETVCQDCQVKEICLKPSLDIIAKVQEVLS